MYTTKHFLFVLVAIAFCISPIMIKAQPSCHTPTPPTFKVHFPVINIPPDEEGQGWSRPDIWRGVNAGADSIEVPNGRPIYVLIVSGYVSNKWLDEMMLYNFARRMMDQGAYVHYAWWNNLLAPYMERPLHHDQSEPGGLDVDHFKHFTSGEEANEKALPGEDYQFVADAKKFLMAIRQNNPKAIIIVAGHSMGGGAIIHLAQQSNELIDILAPIDPVGNRNFPFGAEFLRLGEKDFNWTRWRVSRDNFKGYKRTQFELFSGCVPTGEWLASYPDPPSFPDPLCGENFKVHEAPVITFGPRIVHLFHRYQQEAVFPFDQHSAYHFGHDEPPNGSTNQAPVATKGLICGLQFCDDVGGWPLFTNGDYGCCPSSEGVGWNGDGHGEIVGYRGPGDPIPLGVRFRTSPRCGSECPDKTWPARSLDNNGNFLNGNSANRVIQLKQLETMPLTEEWIHQPYNPFLCLVSTNLTTLYFFINKPPTADAGPDQVVECTGPNGALVTLNGSGSSDPDGDVLGYTWLGSHIESDDQIVQVQLPVGVHCITLTVRDPTGHIDMKKVMITVRDNTAPVVNLSVSPNFLWPPNHKLIDVTATVSASDLCSSSNSIVLHSIVITEGADVVGGGNTSPDIVDAAYNTFDLHFKLRAERNGPNTRRVYTVSYKATDNSGNSTIRSTDVIVENPANNRSSQIETEEPDTELFYNYPFSYPNPFNQTTRINYFVPANEQVTLVVYNSLGQKVTTLVNATMQVGYHSVDFNGKGLAAGVYTYKLTVGTRTVMKKMVLTR